jgi:transposase
MAIKLCIGHWGYVITDRPARSERRMHLDLLPDREAETLSGWLKAHPGIEIVSRDRSRTYANGITEGAPAAVQVADRGLLLKNLREA